MPILVFLGLSVLDLGPMYRQTDVRRQKSDVRHASSLNALYPRGGGIIISSPPHGVSHIKEIKIAIIITS